MRLLERTGATMMAALTIGAACMFAYPTPAASESAEQPVRQLERESIEAALRGDTAVLSRILADDYVTTTAGGKVRNKAETLAQYRSGDLKVTSLDVQDVRVRVYGDTAVMTGRSTIRGRSVDRESNQEFSGVGRFTRVFVKLGGRWQVVADESTPMQEITTGSGRGFMRRTRNRR